MYRGKILKKTGPAHWGGITRQQVSVLLRCDPSNVEGLLLPFTAQNPKVLSKDLEVYQQDKSPFDRRVSYGLDVAVEQTPTGTYTVVYGDSHEVEKWRMQYFRDYAPQGYGTDVTEDDQVSLITRRIVVTRLASCD